LVVVSFGGGGPSMTSCVVTLKDAIEEFARISINKERAADAAFLRNLTDCKCSPQKENVLLLTNKSMDINQEMGVKGVKSRRKKTMVTAQIQLGEADVSYTIKTSTKAKKARISIGIEQGLEITVPEGFPLGRVEDLLREKEKWILDKLEEVRETAEVKKAARKEAQNPSVIRYLDRQYQVVTILDSYASIRVVLEDGKAYVTLPRKDKGLMRQVIQAWYRWAAESLFEERARLLADKMEVNFQKIVIKNQKTRWGSCSSLGNLNINMRLVMAPLEVVDYIIIHELAHLKEMNHSKAFWLLVEKYCPEYKKHLSWLKKHGPTMEI